MTYADAQNAATAPLEHNPTATDFESYEDYRMWADDAYGTGDTLAASLEWENTVYAADPTGGTVSIYA
jgi:hypothetical protein